MKFIPPEILDSIFEHSVNEWLGSSTSRGGPRGTWSPKSRKAFEDLRNYSTVNEYYRDIVHEAIRRAIGKLDENAFVRLIGRAVEESPEDHLLVLRLAYSPENHDPFKDARTGKAFEHLLLCLASASGRYEVVKYLLSKGASLKDTATLDCIDRYRTRMSPIHYSVKYGHESTTRLLIESGAYIDSQAHTDKETPLVEAKGLSGSEHSGIVRLLLEKGANTSLRNPLVYIAGKASAETVELLLSYGAAVDQVSTSLDPQTPLLRAILLFNAEATRKLLEKGADVHRIDPFRGKTPLCTAVSFGGMPGKYEKSNRDIIKLLLEHGADINKGTITKSPLALAAASANIHALKMLLKRGAEWNNNGPPSLQVLMDSHRNLMDKPEGLLILKCIAKCYSPLDRVWPAILGFGKTLINVQNDLCSLDEVGLGSFVKYKIRESSQAGGIGRFFTTNAVPKRIYLQSDEAEFWEIDG